MITLTIQAEDAVELRAKVAALFADNVPNGVTLRTGPSEELAAAGVAAAVASQVAAMTPPAAPAAPAVAGNEQRRRPGRPPKAAAPEAAPAAPAPAPAPAPAAPVAQPETQADTGVDPFAAPPAAPPAAALTDADVRAALSEVNKKHGLVGCREVLAVFATDRISLVKPEDYARFVATCKEWVERAPASAAA